jgi:hypothetical protein
MIEKTVVKRMRRITFLAMAAIGIFWGIWYLINGSVPQTTELKITEDCQIILPCAISHWCDIAFAGILTAIIVFIISNDLTVILVGCLVAGLSVSIVSGLFFGFNAGLSAGLITTLIIGIIFGLSACLEFLFKILKLRIEKAKRWLWPAT